MELLFPQFLYGLLALSIPIIIHLFNFRRYKVVRFPTTRFLREVKEESQKRTRLRHLLILLSRLLLTTALVLAFCQPVIPTQEDVFRSNLNVVVIDNSFSMDMDLEGGRALEVAKNKAFELVNTMDEDAEFLVFTADHQNESNLSIGRRDALEQIKSIASSAAIFDMSAIQSRVKWKTNQTSSKTNIFYFTDLQKNKLTNGFEADSLNRVKIFHLAHSGGANLSLDSVWFEDAVRRLNENEELYFEVKNYGDDDREFELRLNIDGRTMGRDQLKVAGNSSLRSSVSFSVSEPGTHLGTLSIEDAPVSFDDEFNFSYMLDESIKVLYLTDAEDSLWSAVQKLFQTDSSFQLESQMISSIDYSALSNFPLIILSGIKEIDQGLNASLKKAFDAGSSLCVIPALDSKISSYNALLKNLGLTGFGELVESQERVKDIEIESDFYQGVFERIPENVDLPMFNSFFKSEGAIWRSTPLMTLINGSPLFSEYRSENSKLYLFYSDLGPSNSNFTRHALFVPSFLQMAINSRRSGELYVVNRERLLIRKPGRVKDPEQWLFKSRADSAIYFPTSSPEHFIIPDFSGEPGFYELKNKMNSDSYVVAINSNRTESELNTLSIEEIQKLDSQDYVDVLSISGVEKAGLVKEMSEDKELWQLFLLLALLFAAFEIILIKL